MAIPLLTALIDPVSDLLGKFIEDKDQKNRLAHEIATMADKTANEIALAQLDVNKVEAAHSSIFVSGWRPAVGWVCVTGLGWNFIMIPMINLVLDLKGLAIDMPLIDVSTMMPILVGMLGLGAYRTAEKIKGVANK